MTRTSWEGEDEQVGGGVNKEDREFGGLLEGGNVPSRKCNPPQTEGENPNSLRNIYSQDIPKGRPGTFQQDVLQCFIFAFSPDICAPYAYIWTVNRCPTVVTV